MFATTLPVPFSGPAIRPTVSGWLVRVRRGVAAAVLGGIGAIREHMRVRRDLRLLASMSERDLKDLGLSRFDIDAAVRDGRDGPHRDRDA